MRLIRKAMYKEKIIPTFEQGVDMSQEAGTKSEGAKF
jgi:hypothetical protein